MEWVRAMTSTSSHKADVQVQATILLTGKFDQLRAQRLRQRRHFHPLNAASTSAASPSRPKAAMDDETPPTCSRSKSTQRCRLRGTHDQHCCKIALQSTSRRTQTHKVNHVFAAPVDVPGAVNGWELSPSVWSHRRGRGRDMLQRWICSNDMFSVPVEMY